MSAPATRQVRKRRYARIARVAGQLSRATAHPLAYVVMAVVALAWIALGPFTGFSFRWLNSFWVLTMVITFVLVFIVQHTQYRELTAIQLKLNELIRATEGAHNALLDVEALTDSDLDRVRTAYGQLAQNARRDLADGDHTNATSVAVVRLSYLLDVAPAIARDPERLAALDQLGVMDTPAEARFDDLTALARKRLGAPVALVSLVGADRQFFKSACGLPSSTRSTRLSSSFCKYAVAMRKPLVIDDARNHPLVRDNPAIEELGVRAYCGIPLITTGGQAVGSLCVIDHAPHVWSRDDVAFLEHLAALVLMELEGPVGSVEAASGPTTHARSNSLPIHGTARASITA